MNIHSKIGTEFGKTRTYDVNSLSIYILEMFAIISMLLKNLILRISSNSNVKYNVTILRTKGS